MEVAMELLRALLGAKVGATVLVARRWFFPSIPVTCPCAPVTMPTPSPGLANPRSLWPQGKNIEVRPSIIAVPCQMSRWHGETDETLGPFAIEE